jgi:hypothetical protein
MKANSRQEAVIERLVANAFGAQFLFVPLQYYKGEGVDELAMLFYLNGSAGKSVRDRCRRPPPVC